MIYSDGTFVPNTFAGSPIGEVAREARLALNFGVRVQSRLRMAATTLSHQIRAEAVLVLNVDAEVAVPLGLRVML